MNKNFTASEKDIIFTTETNILKLKSGLMKKFHLIATLCLLGLFACEKEPVQPPVPPGPKPGQLEISIAEKSFNSVSYTVTTGENGETYLHTMYDKSFYDGVVGVFYKPEELLKKDGTKGSGTATFTVNHNQPYPDGTTIFILGEADYIILAAMCNDKGEITGEIVTHNVRTDDVTPSTARIALALDQDKTTSTTLAVKLTPDPEVDYYYAVPFQKDDYDTNYAQTPKAEMMKMLLRYSDELEGEQTREWSNLTPATDYYVVVYGMADGLPTSIEAFPCRTLEPQLAPPTIELAAGPGTGENGYEAHNSLIVRLKATGAVAGYYYFDTVSGYEANISYGYTDETLPQSYGNPIDSESIALMTSAEGTVSAHRKLLPDTEYIVLVAISNEEGTTVIGKTTGTTGTTPLIPPVESDLFDILPGEWTAMMTGQIGGTGEEQTILFPVTIAPGADSQTALEYRAYNRLVCLGFNYDGELPYFSPEALLAGQVPGLDYNPWEGNETAARKDYGPKWFLEIAADGTVTVPADDETSFHYLKNYQNYLLGMSASGAYYLFGKEFEVEIEPDGNTLTVKGYEADGETYYPSVLFDNYGDFGIDFKGTSDIILSRNGGPMPPIETPVSFRSNRTQVRPAAPITFTQGIAPRSAIR